LPDREQFLAAGDDDYLAKPFRAEELHVAIGRVLKDSSELPATLHDSKHTGLDPLSSVLICPD
jgi:DNA-binding response OmpR family regulator